MKRLRNFSFFFFNSHLTLLYSQFHTHAHEFFHTYVQGCGSGWKKCHFRRFRFRFQNVVQILVAVPPTKWKRLCRFHIPACNYLIFKSHSRTKLDTYHKRINIILLINVTSINTIKFDKLRLVDRTMKQNSRYVHVSWPFQTLRVAFISDVRGGM